MWRFSTLLFLFPLVYHRCIHELKGADLLVRIFILVSIYALPHFGSPRIVKRFRNKRTTAPFLFVQLRFTDEGISTRT